jgi:uncharacterized protein with PIN domain
MNKSENSNKCPVCNHDISHEVEVATVEADKYTEYKKKRTKIVCTGCKKTISVVWKHKAYPAYVTDIYREWK